MGSLNWLHLSDLHVGMAAQAWLWPRFEKDFLDDLARLHDKAGPWHLVLFTGDLVRSGEQSEFVTLDKILEPVLARLSALGSKPMLVTLPGNHDLVRPSKLNASAMALTQFNTNEEMQSDFWGNDSAGYRKFVNSLFENYLSWRTRWVDAGVHLRPTQEGLIAGDASYVVEGDDLTAKIVTLNSTWLQIAEGDFRAKLVIDPRQLVSAVPGKPDEWLATSDLSVVATHQPSDWLTKSANELWRSDVYTADRFALHAFGHMHLPNTKTTSHGGGGLRREFQAASLFGLERTAEGIERIQGYSAARFEHQSGRENLRIWPRKLVPVANGEKKLKADASQDLDEDNSYLLPLRERERTGEAPSRSQLPSLDSSQPTDRPTSQFKVEQIELISPRHAGHEAVRQAEQQKAHDAWIGERRAFWLVSEWGLGEDEFINSVKQRLQAPQIRTFRLSLEGFQTKSQFLDQVRASHGVTFEEICDHIDAPDGPILILAGAPLRSPPTPACHAIASEVESLVYATKDYLEHGRFVVTTETSPASPSIPIVKLHRLDEPDVRGYVAGLRHADPAFGSADTVAKLHQLTDGYPRRLDAALKQLEVVPLSELVMTNSDLELTQIPPDVPAALPAVIQELRADESGGERSYDLLRSLSLFPRGEQLDRIRRFDNTKPYYAANATMLLDRKLIEAVTYSQMGDDADANSKRLLIVDRNAREYIRTSLTSAENERLERRALELYFGSTWKEGLAKSSLAARIAANPLAPPHELYNCNTIMTRTLVRAKDMGNQVDQEAAVRIAIAFVNKQVAGGHYRNALALAEDILPRLNEGEDGSAAFLQIARAKCLRMTGRLVEAREAYQKIDADGLQKSAKQEILIGLALSYGGKEYAAERRSAAEQAIKVIPSSANALHARVLLAQLDPPSPQRDSKLEALEKKAKSRKIHILVNNIKMFNAEESGRDKRREILRDVVDTSRSTGDFYNRFRAVLRLAENRVPGSPLAVDDKITVMAAYHFFHNERMSEYFARAHAILWKVFDEEGDTRNLLSLFRHSSFIWRLSDLADEEKVYLGKLRLKHDSIVRSNLPGLGRERAYFLARLRAIAAG